MSTFQPDPSQFNMTGAYYPKGHVFAMFQDLPSAQTAASQLAAVPKVGAVQALAPADIGSAFAERAAATAEGGAPSVGREDQFMLRFVELARSGKAGVLIEMADANADDVSAVLNQAGALLAYHYRALVIEELVDTTPRAEAAASGKL